MAGRLFHPNPNVIPAVLRDLHERLRRQSTRRRFVYLLISSFRARRAWRVTRVRPALLQASGVSSPQRPSSPHARLHGLDHEVLEKHPPAPEVRGRKQRPAARLSHEANELVGRTHENAPRGPNIHRPQNSFALDLVRTPARIPGEVPRGGKGPHIRRPFARRASRAEQKVIVMQ